MATRKITRRKSRPITFELLERRELLAGDVLASFDGTTLTVTGDGADNVVFVRQLASGDFRVDGGAGSSTTINGAANFLFSASEILAIDANMNAGADKINVMTDVNGNVAVDGGNGNDTIIVRDLSMTGNLNIAAGDGDDWVNIIRSDVGGDFDFSGGEGNDRMGTDFLNVGGSFDGFGNDGHDRFRLRNSEIDGNVLLDGGMGINKIEMTSVDVETGNVSILTGQQSDNIFLTDTLIKTGDLLIETGNSKDTISLIRVEATLGNITADAGHGSDKFFADDVFAGGDILIDGGTGADEINDFSAFTAGGSVTFNSVVEVV